MLVDRSRIRTRSRVRTRITRLGTLLGLISLVWATANAQRLEGDPSPLGDENYRHTLWSVKDGLYGTVQAVAQAPTAFSSLPHPKGSSVSMASCSGQFVKTGAPISGSITSILPLSSGDLRIGYALGGANALNDGEANFPEFHHVYVKEKNLDLYLKTGSFPEGTILIKELTRVLKPTYPDGSRTEPSGRGYFNGELNGIDASMKDSKRSAKTNG